MHIKSFIDFVSSNNVFNPFQSLKYIFYSAINILKSTFEKFIFSFLFLYFFLFVLSNHTLSTTLSIFSFVVLNFTIFITFNATKCVSPTFFSKFYEIISIFNLLSQKPRELLWFLLSSPFNSYCNVILK